MKMIKCSKGRWMMNNKGNGEAILVSFAAMCSPRKGAWASFCSFWQFASLFAANFGMIE
jgi:hypothetical protein